MSTGMCKPHWLCDLPHVCEEECQFDQQSPQCSDVLSLCSLHGLQCLNAPVGFSVCLGVELPLFYNCWLQLCSDLHISCQH